MSARHVAFVRAIMIGREGLHREVMVDLFRAAGAHDVRNHLTTGNLTFDAAPPDIAAIAEQVEQRIAAIAGTPRPLYVRTLDHVAALLTSGLTAAAPWRDDVDVQLEVEVTFFPGEVPAIELPIVATSGDLCVFASTGRELVSVGRRHDHRSPPAPGGLIERLTGERVTVRAWSTLERVLRAHAERPGSRDPGRRPDR